METSLLIAALCGTLSFLSVLYLAKRLEHWILPSGFHCDTLLLLCLALIMAITAGHINSADLVDRDALSILTAGVLGVITFIIGPTRATKMIFGGRAKIYVVASLYVIAFGLVVYLHLPAWHLIGTYATLNIIILYLLIENQSFMIGEELQKCKNIKRLN